MSRKSTTAQLASYLGRATTRSGLVPSLSTVYAYPPRVADGADFYVNLPKGIATGAVLYIDLGRQREHRIEIRGGAPGGKFVVYSANLVTFLRYSGREAEVAMADSDDYLDGLHAWLRLDPTLGSRGTGLSAAPGTVFQAGEGDERFGGEDIDTTPSAPKMLAGGTLQRFMITRLTVCEVV